MAVSETDQFIQLKKALASHTDLNTLQNEGGDSNLGVSIENFLKQIEKGVIPEGFTWDEAKSIIISKFDEVTKKFEAERPISSLSPIPNADNYSFEEYHEKIIACLNRFEDSSPFTLGRICELLLEPRKHYDRGDKFLRAFEKCVTVTSTNETNGSNGNGHVANGHENGHHAVVEENGSAMELNASPQIGIVEAQNGGSKQEDAVSSSVIDEQQENGQIEQNTVETDSMNEVEQSAGESKSEPMIATEVMNGEAETDNIYGSAKRQADEPDTAAKKARTEDSVENGSDVDPVVEPEITKSEFTDPEVNTGETMITEQAIVDNGTAV